ncbi:MAG TPA: 6,7-dimethyl-8-ribityllumazine synthase [Stellaceae bacterium]|nr:6,7-dimethyl-8-ribityllumazine synthase [Stellaceae bacterium]
MAGAPPHVMIVEARYYAHINDELARGAITALEAAGATFQRFTVPGAFEIPAAIRFAAVAAERGAGPRFDGYVALGCVIRGETTHYVHVCEECARGIQDIALRHELAIGFGVLTVENEAQALARAGVDKRNKGGEAANACLAMIALKRGLGLLPR